MTLVFTDIVGSTELYAHLGDGEALKLVQQYFEVLFNSFASRGRIVKTIGDAVMASFSSSEAAVEAVAEALDQLAIHCINPATGAPLEMRVGIHSGTTVAVSLNGVNDYFGQTVNMQRSVPRRLRVLRLSRYSKISAHQRRSSVYSTRLSLTHLRIAR